MTLKKDIALLCCLLIVLVVALFLGGVDGSEARQAPESSSAEQNPRRSQIVSSLPSNPKGWICHDAVPVTQEEIDAWCDAHRDRGLPLPPDLRDPPPIADFDQYLTYSKNLTDFLTQEEYKDLGWISDAHWRFSGPSMGGFSHNYGPHFPLKVYYSPEVVNWLCSGRRGEIPDGAMMIKAMNLYFPSVDVSVAGDGCMDINFEAKPFTPNIWTPMIKSSRSSYDGWLWMLQQFVTPLPPQFPPPLFDNDPSAFTQALNLPIEDNPDWYPTGGLLEQGGFITGAKRLKIPNVVMLNPLAGFPYCMSCHSTARKQSTFASMDNILGRELRYKFFKTDLTPTPMPTPGDFSPFPKPFPPPSKLFEPSSTNWIP